MNPWSTIPSWMAEYLCVPPIIVFSFNRPRYLRPVLESLRTQEPPVNQRRVHLFQDGAVNAHSGNRYAENKDIEECVRLFREFFPNGRLHRSATNLGICQNYRAAEDFAFKTLKAPVAYFFEDDLVLSKHYISALDVLRKTFCREPKIGYFNACGSHTSSLEEQEARSSAVMGMGHSWGFGLKRTHWLEMQPLLGPYYRLMSACDYRRMPKPQIFEFYRRWGISHPAASLDGAYDLATHVLGRWRASTFPAFGRYIGAQGTHFVEERFKRHRFDETWLYTRPLGKVILDKAEMEREIARRQKVFRKVYEDQLAALRG